MAPARIDRMISLGWKLESLDWKELEQAYRGIENDAAAVIAATLPSSEEYIVRQRAADLRFAGQGFEIVTDLPPGPYDENSYDAIREAFAQSYGKTFGQVPQKGEIEVINIRVALSVNSDNANLNVETAPISGVQAVQGTRQLYLAHRGQYFDVPVYERAALSLGQVISGPAIVQEASSTLILPEGSEAKVDGSLSLIVSLHSTQDVLSSEAQMETA
jgi:N-methylhydantoinase A